MRDKNGRFIKGFSGNPSGIKRIERLDHQEPPGLPPGEQAPEGPRLVLVPQMPDQEHLDTWMNSVTGFGSPASDKRHHTHFVANTLSYHDAIELWRGDDLAARAIESVPADCFRQGYDVHINDEGSYDDLKEDLIERLGELKVDEIVERAYKYERAYGGGGILLGVDDGGSLDEPLIPEKVRDIKWLTVLEPIEFYPATYYQDPASPKYGEPEYYRLQAFTVSGAGTVIGVTDRRAPPPTTHLIHETRLVILGGIRVSRYQRNSSLMGPLWGDSMLVRMLDILRDFNIAWSSAGIIVTDFAQTVISMENLMALVAKQSDALVARLRAMDMARSTARAALIDTKETLKRESTNVQGLPELLDRLSGRLAAAIDMPLSLLMGNTPKGLGADASQDLRLYYDRVQSVQNRRIGPVLKFITNLVMRSLRQRKLPKKWEIKWNPLWQLTDQEKADARLTQARADSMYIKMGAVTSDEIRRSRFLGGFSFDTQIQENKKAPGFMAPLPPGVLPGSMPGMIGKPGPPAAGGKPGAPKMMGPNAHSVSGYARRNPNASRLEKNPKEGGDTEGRGKATRDHMDDRPGVAGQFAGLPVVVECPKGNSLSYELPDGSQGEVYMSHDYGYIQDVQGTDGDSLDAWFGPNEESNNVYIMHVMNPPEFEQHQQDKVMLGFDCMDDAKSAFMKHYDDDRFYGGATEMNMSRFISIFGLMSRQQPAGTPPPGGDVMETQPLHTNSMYGADAQAAIVPAQSSPDDRAQAEDLLSHQDDLGDQISRELSADYPKAARKWLKDVHWHGPTRVPVSMIDYENKGEWRASEEGEQEKVKKFAERIAGGWEKPILLVRRPGEHKLMIVDGHHRALAYLKTEVKPMAYIGDVPEDKGPWDEMHDAQRKKADKHERRSAGVKNDDASALQSAIYEQTNRSAPTEIAEKVEESKHEFPMEPEAHMDFIRHENGHWNVYSESGKRMGSYSSKEQAVQRLRTIEYFKAHPNKDEVHGGVFEQVASGESVHGVQGEQAHGKQETEVMSYATDKPAETGETPIWNAPLRLGNDPDDR